MTKFIFSKKSLWLILCLSSLNLGLSSSALGQSPLNSDTSGPSQIGKSELDAINRQPIAQGVKAKDRVQGTDQRRLSYELKQENGTHVREYREGNKPVDIEVDSSFGTHYHMSTPTTQVPTIREQSLERVPSLRMPF